MARNKLPLHRSLRGKLLLFGVLPTVIVLSGVIIHAAQDLYHLARTGNEQLLRSVADEVAKEVERGNTRAVLAAQVMAMAQTSGLFGQRQASNQLAHQVLQAYPEFTGAYFGYEPDADGQDAANAGLAADSPMAGTADAQGRFRVQGLAEGETELFVSMSRGDLDVPVAVIRVVGRKGITTDVGDVVLGPERLLAGVVRDANGRPAGGVQLMAITRGFGEAGHAITGPDGKFAIPVFAGPFRIIAWKRGAGTVISAPTEPRRGIDLRLEPEARVRLVPDEEREWTALSISTADGYALATAYVDDDYDVVRALPPCPLRFTFDFEDGSQIVRDIELTAGRELRVRAR